MDFENILNHVINELNNQTDNELQFNVFLENDINNVINNSFDEDKYISKKTCPVFLNNLNEQFISNELIEKDIHCSICLDKFKVGDKCIELVCKDVSHYFHNGDSEDCNGILPWLKENNTCPVCRYEFPEEEVEVEVEEEVEEVEQVLTDLSPNSGINSIICDDIIDEIDRLINEINELDDETRLQHALMSSINEK